MNRPAAFLEVLAGAPGCTLQDAGRLGHRHEGIPAAGWMDRPLAQAAHALVGNAGDEATLELRGPGPVLRAVGGEVHLALAGTVSARWQAGDAAPRPVPAWRPVRLAPGDTLHLAPVMGGVAYLAVAGGFGVAPQLGSRATYARAGLGGLHGRALTTGERLPCGHFGAPAPRLRRAPAPWQATEGPIRVMAGPQRDHFTDAAWATLLDATWTATAEQDRMGLRLAGPALAHVSPQAADIVSDGVVPGVLQVPASGQPIVLLADAQTVGGYPKIATVISADLPRIAQARPGQTLRFAAVDAAGARAALADLRARWQAWAATLVAGLPPGEVDEAALWSSNLVDGVVDCHHWDTR